MANLIGLRWRAPYLHDGGVAVGRDAERAVGLPGTLGRGELPDAANSLRALVDRSQRERVVAANAADPATAAMHNTGAGHPFWVDAAANFSPEEQAALVSYLLDL